MKFKLGDHVFWLDRDGCMQRGRFMMSDGTKASVWAPGFSHTGEMRFPPLALLAENSLDARERAKAYASKQDAPCSA